jgi:hypothetical protein
MNSPHDLCDWLAAATRGLPKAAKRLIHDEISAHYDDTVDDLRRDGATLHDARIAALAQLGDAHITALALRQTHLAPRRYRQAALVAVLSLLSFVLGALFTIQPVLFLLISVGCTTHVLYTLRELLTHDADDKYLAPALALIVAGTGVMGLFSLFSGQAQSLVVVVLTDPFIVTRLDLYAQPLTADQIAQALLALLIGVGWLWLGEGLMRFDHILSRLAFGLRLCVFGVGLGLIGVGLSLLLRNSFALNLCNLLVIVCGTARHALLAFIFLRAARTQAANPFLQA